MQRALFPNQVKPDETVFQYEVSSRVDELLARFGDLSDRGIASGLDISLNSANTAKIDIAPGVGYTPQGERISVLQWIRGIPLSGASYTDSSNYTVTVKPGGSYEEGVKNYILLRYTEVEFDFLKERGRPYTKASKARSTFEVEVLTETDFNNLVHSSELIRDVSAVPFPSTDPQPSRQFRLLVGIVTARGLNGSTPRALLDSSIQPVDPVASQPVNLTGIRVTQVSSNTSPGVGVLIYTAASVNPTTGETDAPALRWQAPLDDSGRSVQIDIDADESTLVLTSSNTSLSIVVDIVTGSLPTVDVTESVSVISRLNLVIPQVTNQPSSITGVAIRQVSTNTQVGIGSLAYDSTLSTIAWKAPGDTAYGTPADVTDGGLIQLRSSASEFYLTVSVTAALLPSDNATDNITIRGLYDLAVPVLTAADRVHRAMIGSGTLTPGNPHGTDIDAVLASSRENPFVTHQNRFHVNGISSDSPSDFLYCVADEDENSITPTAAASDAAYLVQGKTFTQILSPDTPKKIFSSVDDGTGYYLAYITNEGAFVVSRLTGSLFFEELTEELPDETTVPYIRILDIDLRPTATPPSSFPAAGTLEYDAATRRMRWKAPGDADFGAYQRVESDLRLYAATGTQGIWGIRLGIDIEKLGTTSGTVSVPIYANPAGINNDTVMKLACVLWKKDVSRMLVNTDLRQFYTADTAARLSEINRQISESLDGLTTLVERFQEDRIRQLDNGILSYAERGTLQDNDPDAFKLFRTDSNSFVQMELPAQSTTYAFVNGREIGVNDPAMQVFPAPGIELTADIPDNPSVPASPAPDQVATLYQFYLSEFGQLRHHARVRETGDILSKTLRGFQVVNISPEFPAGSVTIRYTCNSPNVFQTTFRISINGTDFGWPAVTNLGLPLRVYAEDGKNWMEIMYIQGVLLPIYPVGTTVPEFISDVITINEQVTVLDALDTRLNLELGMVAYDGSAEATFITDTRRLGSVGARALASDALDGTKPIRSQVRAETCSDGVIRGLAATGVGTTQINWQDGVVEVDGRRMTIAAGSSPISQTGFSRAHLIVDPYGNVVIQENILTSTDLRFAHVATLYFPDTSSAIIGAIEDRRTPPGETDRNADRKIVPVLRAHGSAMTFRHGIDTAGMFTSANLAAGDFWNCHVTQAGQNVAPYFWLDDTSQPGIFTLHAIDLDPATINNWPYSSTDTFSTFAVFLIPAGDNPRSMADIQLLSVAAFPIEITDGITTVYPLKKLVVTGTQIVDNGNGSATLVVSGGGGGTSWYQDGVLVKAGITEIDVTGTGTVAAVVGNDARVTVNVPSSGGGGGSDVRQFGVFVPYSAIPQPQGAGPNETFNLYPILTFNAPSSGYKMQLNIAVTFDTGSGGSRSPVVSVVMDKQIMTVNNGTEEVQESVPRGRDGHPVYFTLGNIAISSGNHSIGLQVVGRDGSTIKYDGRIQISVIISKT